MAHQQPPVPNAATLLAAVTGMTAEGNTFAQGVQNYNTHQQVLNTELSRCGNYNVAHIHQQLAGIQASIAELSAKTSADSWNLKALIRNGKVTTATGALVAMRSVEPGLNPQVQINQLIPNFPRTPNQVSQMTGAHCHSVLRSLDEHIPQGPQVRLIQLRTAVREAIGLVAL